VRREKRGEQGGGREAGVRGAKHGLFPWRMRGGRVDGASPTAIVNLWGQALRSPGLGVCQKLPNLSGLCALPPL